MFRAALAGVLVIRMSGVLAAAPLEIGRTPVLGATLPTSTTWQVEQQQAGGAWAGTGVLVPGRGVGVSVRMDGFPAGASYRFQRVAGAVATIAPTRGGGWNLAGQEAGAGQVEIERSADLAAWGREALVFPGADGRYVRALREPLGVRGFFRAEVPGLPTGDASASGHVPLPNYQGASGFGPIYDDMPQIFKDGFIGALDRREYDRDGIAAAAGECYELAGPFGRTTVMITDTSNAPAGVIESGRSYFDLGPVPNMVLNGGAAPGELTAGVRLVPAPVTGNVKLFVAGTASIFYTELRPYNYRAGVRKVELQTNGSAIWVDLPRRDYNSFVYQSGGSVPTLAFPVKVRVTSRFGEVILFPSIPAMTDNLKIAGPAQFTVFPELAPVPEHRLQPMYRDALTKVTGDQWAGSGYGGATVTEVDPAVHYAGTASLRLSGLGGGAGATFSEYPGFRRPEYGVLKLAIRSAAPTLADQVGMAVAGLNTAGGPPAFSALIQLPALSTNWQVFRVPLEASGVPPIVNGLQFYGRTLGALPSVWIDEVSFEAR